MHTTLSPRHRHRILAAAALALATGASLLAGCSDASNDSSSADPSTSTPGASDRSVRVATTEPQTCTVRNESTQLRHTVAGHTYNADLHRPPAGPQSLRLPAVIDLHGVYSDGPTQAALTGFGDLADLVAAEGDGFLVVEPTGQPGPIDGATGWEFAALEEPDRDDAQYLSQLIDTLVADHCADASRVYLAGYSNGGFFAAEYACAHPEVIAAIATVAGFLQPQDCTLTVPVVAFHGTQDPVVPWGAGGTSILVSEQSPPALVTAIARGAGPQFAESAAAAGCDATPERAATTGDVTLTSWKGCAEGADHLLYEIAGGGHTWPGATELPGDAELIGATTSSIDATRTIWEFFSTHQNTR